jgi:hypothetical protein
MCIYIMASIYVHLWKSIEFLMCAYKEAKYAKGKEPNTQVKIDPPKNNIPDVGKERYQKNRYMYTLFSYFSLFLVVEIQSQIWSFRERASG